MGYILVQLKIEQRSKIHSNEIRVNFINVLVLAPEQMRSVNSRIVTKLGIT